MKKLTVLFFVFICLISCDKKDSTSRIEVEVNLLNDSIYTVMPGDLVVFDNYLVWTDPFSKEYFLHVHEKNTGQEIGVMGKIGLGPDEFISPLISDFVSNREILVYDPNMNKRALLSIDSLLQKKNYFRAIPDETDLNQYEELERNLLIKRTDDGDPYFFNIKTPIGISSFGKYPIEKLNFHFDIYKAYDPTDGLLVVSTMKFPYIALYKKNNNTFDLLWEIKEKVNYYETNHEIRTDSKRRGMRAITFTKDYIVTIERDIKYDKTDEDSVGRDISKLPQTIFVYGYDSELKYIANLNYPIGRIAGNRDSNTLYAIGGTPEYAILSCELP